MKLGKLGLMGISLIGFILFLITVFTYSDIAEENMQNSGMTAFIVFSLAVVILSFVLFLVYKFTDLGKFPKHRKEMLLLLGVIVGSLVLGAVFTGFGDWIKATILAFSVLLIFAFAFLIWDTIKSVVR